MKLIQFDKKLDLPGAVSVTVGTVIGVGIFVIVGDIGANSGSWMPLVFCVAALPAIFGTMVAVSLGGTIPADGGGFYYTSSLLGRYAGSAASALVVLGAMGALAAVSVGVANYISAYFPDLPRPAVAIGLILLSWAINYVGIMASVKFQIAMVVQLVSALLLVIFAALLGGGNPDFSQPLPKGYPGFLEACAVAGLAYTGFNIIGELGDEINNPRRNVPLTVIIGLGIITFVYVGVGWVIAGTMDVGALEKSKVALLDTAMSYLPGWCTHYLNLAALTGAVTSMNAVFLAVPREFSALAEDNILPRWIMKFNPKRQTFPISIAIVAVAGCAMTLIDLDPDIWGLVCVAGLLLANVFFSIGAMRLFSLFPDKVASAPFAIKKSWLFPSGIISAILSLGFVGLAVTFFWPVAVAMALMVSIALLLCWKTRPSKIWGHDSHSGE